MAEQAWLEHSDITFPLAAATKLLVDEGSEPDYDAVVAVFAEENITGLELVEDGRTVSLDGAASEDEWASENEIKEIFATLAPIIPDGRYAQFESTFVDADSRKFRLIAAGERIIEDFPNISWDDPKSLVLGDGHARPFAVNLDAESVRAEIYDAFANGGNPRELTADRVDQLRSLPDIVIGDAIQASLDDHFWAAFDSARSDAIAHLDSSTPQPGS